METKSEKLEALASLDNNEIAELGDDWSIPISVQNLSSLPNFPIDTLPSIIRNYIEAVAEHTQTPIDMSAIASLAVIASTLQGKYEVEGKEGYTEPLNLYCLIIAKPAERKSAIMSLLTKPLYDYEREENKKRAPIISREEIELNFKRKKIKNLGDKTKATQEDIEKAVMLEIECNELERRRTKDLRLIADDCTPEALTSLLADNNGKISVVSAEGGIFDTIAGRYSKNMSIDTLLKAHCGDPIRVDRKGRNAEYVENPVMTILLAIQENVLEGLIQNETFRGRGLTARFLYCKPTSPIGTRKFSTNFISEEVKRQYQEFVFKLLDLSQKTDQKILKLSSEAFDVFENFYNEIEQRLVDDLEFMSDWAGKLSGTCLRISGILHLMDYSNIETENDIISSEIMEKAIKISKYFLENSKYAYSIMGVDKEMVKAKFIINKLKKQTETQLKRHEILKMSRSANIQKVGDIEEALKILIEYGYIRELPTIKKEGSGRKPDIVYELNPLYFS